MVYAKLITWCGWVVEKKPQKFRLSLYMGICVEKIYLPVYLFWIYNNTFDVPQYQKSSLLFMKWQDHVVRMYFITDAS